MGCSGSKATKVNEVTIKPKEQINNSAKEEVEKLSGKKEKTHNIDSAPSNQTKENSKKEVVTEEADSSKKNDKLNSQVAGLEKKVDEVPRKHSEKSLDKPIDNKKLKNSEEQVKDWLTSVYSSVKTHL